MKTFSTVALVAALSFGLGITGANAAEQQVPPAPTSMSKPTEPPHSDWKDVPGSSALDLKGLPDADTAVYAQGLKENPDGWHFLYGPVHRPGNKSAVYMAKGRNGSVIIACGSTGTVEMIFGLAGAYTETGLDDTAEFSVGEKTHNLRVRAAKNPSEAVETVYYATGLDVLGILRAMASLNVPKQLPHVINISIKDRQLALPSPWPVGNAQEMLGLCAAWHNQHMATVK